MLKIKHIIYIDNYLEYAKIQTNLRKGIIMEKFTKKWDNYINLKWKEYLTPKKISDINPN